jgi:hypothetical protein
MSLNGKYISSKEIIANVLRDNLYKSQDIEVSALIEWVSECLDLIGVPYAYVNQLACIEIKDHRGKLPCDLHTVIQIAGLKDNGDQFPIRETTGTFHPLFSNTNSHYGTINVAEPIGYDDKGNPIFNFNNYELITPKSTSITVNYNYNDVTYRINNDYVFTSLTECKLLMSYLAYPVDKEGYPLIPDNIKFKQAVQAFLRYKLDYRLWRKGELLRDVFEYSEREYMWYVGAATTAGLMPSLDMMESWKNMHLKIMPRFNEHSKFFDDLGTQQIMTNGRKHRRY